MIAIIRPCTVADIEQAPRLAELLAAYAEESHLPELGEPEPCFATYRAMEAGGALHAIGAFSPDLVGFAILLVYGLPHYAGRRVGSLESFFVLPGFRGFGTGRKLLHAAELQAAELGAAGFLVSAPLGGRLDAVLSKSNYRPSNIVFVRSLP
jgi:GNAT superfamily N-acetyltransferase